ncbi:hypothetical protein [Rhodobacteraceae bacterium DSL-40]|uniref:hypothetical protein n=1 Tax=Amaricoccus sp. B4 TaxID=3368557 RepID=UPI000DAB92E9
MDPSQLRSRAGKLLYRELPEEYRFRDPHPVAGDLGDLEAFLHGFGHLLDLIRGTTEQAYADAFAEPADNGRAIQPWLIPYLAELVGAELRAPDPEARRQELNETVSWYKSKGSLRSIDEISDVIAGDETVVVEGWRRTLTTPRMSLPPFTAPLEAMGDGDPAAAPGLPQGTPEGFINRAIVDADGSDPLHAIRIPRRDGFGRTIAPETVYWRPLARRGTPCFPGAYDDTSLRTPDLRATPTRTTGPHPRRTLVHVRPPEGFFARGVNGTLAPTTADLAVDPAETRTQVFGPREVLEALGVLEDLLIDGALVLPDRLMLTGDLTVPAGTDLVCEDLLFAGTIRLEDETARAAFRRCAIDRLVIAHPTDEPAVKAQDCLFNAIRGGVGFAELVYCTVLEETELERLHASDCVFAGPLPDLDCAGETTCIRFSRVPDLSALAGCAAENAPSNTDDDPNFIQLWFEEGDGSVLRPALFGEPGAGVLDLASSDAVLRGAENEGEMGAYNHRFHAARIRALRLKLEDHLPFGQEIAIRYDPYLSRPPARAV